MESIEVVRAGSRVSARGNYLVVDVTSHAREPWHKLSPFYVWQEQIPVPGMPGRFSDSVEGIWQGLKMIAGKTDESLFSGRPHKREGDLEGHLFDGQAIGLAEARKEIYIPAYTFVLEHRANDLVQELLSMSFDGPLYLLDVTDNCNYTNIRKPLSHAGILRGYLLNKRSELVEKTRLEHARALRAQGGNGNLDETLGNMSEWQRSLNPLQQKAFAVVLQRLQESDDGHLKRYAGRLLAATEAQQ